MRPPNTPPGPGRTGPGPDGPASEDRLRTVPADEQAKPTERPATADATGPVPDRPASEDRLPADEQAKPTERPATADASEPVPDGPASEDRLRIVPADEASWADLQAVFGTSDYPSKCQCQRFKILGDHWRSVPLAERAERLREQTGCDNAGAEDAGAAATSGLVAYLDDEPVGWCAVEPRVAYPRLARTRVPWTGRQEDKADDSVWAVTCIVVRKGFRGRGLTYPLARATIGFARERGARALEAYPMITQPGVEITWGELHVGSRNVFADAGFAEVSRPTLRRVVMRIDFPPGTANP